MHRFLTLLLSATLLALPQSLCGQQYIFTNDNVQDDFGNNTTTAYKIGPNGKLAYLASYTTNGLGSSGEYYAAVGVLAVRTPSHECLFVSDGYSLDVAAFTMRLADGSLTPAVGSPFPLGGYDLRVPPANQSKLPTAEIGLAVAQKGKTTLLFAGDSVSRTISVLKVGFKCSLKLENTYTVKGAPEALKTTPNGKYLISSLLGQVDSFRIDYRHSALLELGPFPAKGAAAGLDITCDGTRAYFGDLSGPTQVEVFQISPKGKLGQIQFFADDHGENSYNVLLSPDEKVLYVSNTQSGQITVLQVGADGKVSYSGIADLKSPGAYTQNMVTTADGKYLFVAEENTPDQIGVLRANGTSLKEIGQSPVLEPPNDYPATPFTLTSVPGKSCR